MENKPYTIKDLSEAIADYDYSLDKVRDLRNRLSSVKASLISLENELKPLEDIVSNNEAKCRVIAKNLSK